MIELRNVTFTYPGHSSPVLRDLTWSAGVGQFVLVVGPSGSGKSTLLRTLDGLVPHFSGGSITGLLRVAGHDPIAEGPHAMSRVVGLVQQDPEAQFVVDTVEDELVFGMENQGLPQPLMRKRVEEVLDQLAIAHLRQRRITSLSAGEKQRVAIGSVLTLQPKVLVLDEPTSQLDPQSAEEVLTALRRLNEDLGLTIVLSEHRLERVVQYADQMVYLPAPGELPRIGDPRDVLPHMPFAPPLVKLARAFGWQPIPLTIKEARPLAAQVRLEPAERSGRETGAAVSVEARDVWFDYDGTEALAGLSMQAARGEVVALMGRNGSGKTTLLKHLAGLLRPRRGSVVVDGLDTRTSPADDVLQRVGYVPQDPSALLFADTVQQELEFTRHARGLPPVDVGPWLDALDLAGLGERYPRELSVGQRQRVALAAILVAEPPILLLDEPTRGLDPNEKEWLADFLQSQSRLGRTVIMATHDVELAASCCQRVVITGCGQVVVDGPAREVMSHSLVFATQVNKLFGDPRLLTVRDVLEALP
jgi:energy-coupling factor transporter ATP-binding protein EcfA2